MFPIILLNYHQQNVSFYIPRLLYHEAHLSIRHSGNAWPQVTNADIFKLNYGDLIDASTYISRPQANYDILAVYSCKMPQDVKIRTKIKGKGRE